MEEIIRAINSAQDAEKKAEAFFGLSKDEKRTLLEGLRHMRTQTLGMFLNAIYPQEKDKDIQKLIRKLLFQLKSAGIKVDEPQPAGEPVIRKIEEVRDHKGFLTNYDETQTRLVVAGLEIKKNIYVFLNAETHFSDGLVELMTSPVDKKSLEEILKAYRHDIRPTMVFEEISPAYAVYLIEEASNRSGKFRDEIKPLKSFSSSMTNIARKPEDIYRLTASDTGDMLALGKILTHSIFDPFFLSWTSLEEDKKAYSAIGDGSIVLPQHMVEERKMEFVKRLSERGDITSLVPFLKRMLEDYAYLFHCMKDFSSYKGLTEHTGNQDVLQEAFSFFLKKTLDRKEDKPQDTKQDGGLIVNPYG